MAEGEFSFFRGLDLPARNLNTDLSIAELKRYRRYDRLLLIMYYPHYYEAAKIDMVLRTLVIDEAERYLKRRDKTENMELLCNRLKDEYQTYEKSLPVDELVTKIRALRRRDLCTIAARSCFLRTIIIQDSFLRNYLLLALEQEIEGDHV